MTALRAIRKRLGLTQAQLAEQLGVSRNCIIEREAGGPVSRETVLAMTALVLLDALERESAEVLSGTAAPLVFKSRPSSA